MKITIEFHTDNSAFGETEDEATPEVYKILKSVMNHLDGLRFLSSPAVVPLRDSNGNTIGTLTISPR